jgi:hypothetical protein
VTGAWGPVVWKVPNNLGLRDSLQRTTASTTVLGVEHSSRLFSSGLAVWVGMMTER